MPTPRATAILLGFAGLETPDRFAWHRSRQHVAANADMINGSFAHLFKHSLKRRQIAVDVVERRTSHNIPASYRTPDGSLFRMKIVACGLSL